VKKGQWSLWSRRIFGMPGDPYLERRRIIQTPFFGIYTHRIHREDRDRDPHDHPWAFLSLVYWGGYVEKVWPTKGNAGTWHTRVRRRGSLRWMSRRSAHIITRTTQPLRTLVIVGRDHDMWGFWTPGGYVRWQDYVNRWPVAAGDPQA
jgi:hypothetical protein